MVEKRRKPKWPVVGRYLKKMKNRWIRPRGIHNKVKLRRKGKGSMPSIGYRNPKEIRGLHPSGFKEVFVENMAQLMKVDSKKEAVRFAKIGKKKKIEMLKKTEELKLKVLNP